MPDAFDITAPAGFALTSWRGLAFCHPLDWEVAGLSVLGETGQCVLVDRRFQRLQITWQTPKGVPDLPRMYEDLRKSPVKEGQPAAPATALKGIPDWTGAVRQDEAGTMVFAGRHFPAENLLVQAAIVWPSQRDPRIDRALLDSVTPWPAKAPTVLWQALGLSARVPSDFELIESSSLVGRVVWEFRQKSKPHTGLLIERIAMVSHWLKGTLEDWLPGTLPEGYRMTGGAAPIALGRHEGVEAIAWHGSMMDRLRRVVTWRRERAWHCPQQQRVYRIGVWRRGHEPPDPPDGLRVRCCE